MSRHLRVLVVCSYNSGKLSPFVREQVNSLRNISVNIDYFKVVGKGALVNANEKKEKVLKKINDIIVDYKNKR